MEKNEKGFMLTETLIVSTIVLGVLIFMYSQFRNLNNSFNQAYKYNTVEGIYKTNEIKKFIESDAIDNMIISLNNSENEYIDITECNISTYSNVNFCKLLYEKSDVNSILLLSEDVSLLLKSNMDGIQTGTKNFIKYVGQNSTGNYYRIVVSYNDGTYSTLRIDVLRDTYNYAYTGDVQVFKVPKSGYYQVELWGAAGGDIDGIANGGNGAYTKGIIYLEQGNNLYLYVGEKGNNNFRHVSNTVTDLGSNYTWNYEYSESNITFNSGTYSSKMNNGFGMSGGGATDIRLINGNWNDFESLKSRLMVASSGSGAINYYRTANGVPGGALEGFNGVLIGSDGNIPGGGTQISGGLKGNGKHGNLAASGGFGYAGQALFGTSSGGSGYYGGGSSPHGSGTVGVGGSGSSFISGYAGCDAISKDSTEDNIIHTGQSIHYSGYKFENSEMIAGDEEMPNYEGGTMIGNEGNGYARITAISTT